MDSPIKKAGYENIYVDCPHCEQENTYNRISDLSTVEPIDRMDNIECEHCKRDYSIFRDEIQEAKYKWFLVETEILKQRKNYMLYVLYLCQACETFFEQAIINKKLDRNKKLRYGDGHLNCQKYNQELKNLNKASIYNLCGDGPKKTRFKKAAFDNLRKVFLHEFDSKGNQKVDDALDVIRGTKIHELRNKVVHKNAYRPTLTEIERFDSLTSALYFLGHALEVKESIYLLMKDYR